MVEDEVTINAETVKYWQTVPMHSWPEHVFQELGLRNLYGPGNMTIRREALERTRHLTAGDLVECGVFRGQSLASLAWWLREIGDPRIAWGFDSFDGFPPAAPEDSIDGVIPTCSQPHYYGDTSLEIAKSFVAGLDLSIRVRLVKGFFSETLDPPPVDKISVLVLDCDLYESYLTCLKHLYGRVLSGGWIIFDEYFSPKYPGARHAVDEFFRDKTEKPFLAAHLLAEHPYERWYVIKR